jgi:hypothetical protein
MAWKRNKNIDEMYRMYCEGYSLAQVANSWGCTRQSVWELFRYNGLATRPKRKPLPYVMFNGEKYTRRSTGYFGKTTGKRTLLHRDVWEYHNGKIPDGYDIHHVDCDRENNSIDNLECLPKAEHTRKYSPHNNQYTRGRKRNGGR